MGSFGLNTVWAGTFCFVFFSMFCLAPATVCLDWIYGYFLLKYNFDDFGLKLFSFHRFEWPFHYLKISCGKKWCGKWSFCLTWVISAKNEDKTPLATDRHSTTTSFALKTLRVQLTSLIMQKVTHSHETPTDLPEKMITFRYWYWAPTDQVVVLHFHSIFYQ